MKKKITLLGFAIAVAVVASLFCAAVSATEPAPKVEVYGYNLIFGDQVSIEYAVTTEGSSEITESDVGVLVWREDTAERTVETADADLKPFKTATVGETECYILKYTDLSAKEMNDKVYAMPYVTANGQTVYGEEVEYSVCTYAQRKLGLAEGVVGTDNESLKDLIRNMLHYGASSQKYHGYKIDALATDILDNRIKLNYEGMEGIDNPNPTKLEYASGTYTLQNPVKEGHTFKCWADIDNEWAPITEIDTSVTKTYNLAAVWELNKYTITYKGTMGVLNENPESYTVLDYTTLQPLKKYDYDFVGWRLTNEAGQWEAIEEIPDGTTGNLMLTAEWKLKPEFEGFTYVVDDNYFLPDGQNFCILTGVTANDMTALEIPTVFNHIQAGALKYCSQLEELTLPFLGSDYTGTAGSYLGYVFGAETALGQNDYIPQSLKKITVNGSGRIGINAFRDCVSLTDIVVSGTSCDIGQNAYLGCTSLVSLTTPVYTNDAMIYEGKTYPWYQTDFYYGIPGSFDRANHKSAYIEDYLEIPRYSFETLHINGGEIGSHAFHNNLGFKHLIIEGVEVIRDSAFYDAETMETLTLHEGLKQIQDQAFYSCGNKKFNEVIIPNSVTNLGGNDGGVYDLNYDGTSYSGPMETTGTRAGAFGFCISLSKIVIGDGVEVIPYGCFDRTIGHAASPELELTLGKNVRVIGPFAFYASSEVQNQTDCRISKLTNNSQHKEMIVYTQSSSRTDIGTTSLLDALNNCDNPPEKIYLGNAYKEGYDFQKEYNGLEWNGMTVEKALSYKKFQIVVYSYYNPYENGKAVDGLTYWHSTDPDFWITRQYDIPVLWEKPAETGE